MNLFWCGWDDFQHLSGFSTTVRAFLNSQAKLQSRSNDTIHFLQMAHKKSLFEHLQRNKLFLCVCWFVYLFLYFVVVIFFCWTQLLGPHHAERPNMALPVNRSPGATRQKTGENHPAKFSARWLPAGIIWGPERLFPLLLSFPFPAWWAGWKAQP